MTIANHEEPHTRPARKARTAAGLHTGPPQNHAPRRLEPERQKAFIEALADTGSVEIACRQVNMLTEGAYYLRGQPGAEEFRRAWTAALDMGVQRLRDVAMERALYGELVPVFHPASSPAIAASIKTAC